MDTGEGVAERRAGRRQTDDAIERADTNGQDSWESLGGIRKIDVLDRAESLPRGSVYWEPRRPTSNSPENPVGAAGPVPGRAFSSERTAPTPPLDPFLMRILAPLIVLILVSPAVAAKPMLFLRKAMS